MADRITVVGTLGNDPEERNTTRGGVVQFRLASTDRRRDAQGNWADGTTSWYRVNAWGELGRNALTSLRKGQRVIVAGDLTVSEWDGADGHKGRSVEIRAAALGHDLTFGTSRFERGQRAQPTQTTEQAAPQEQPTAPVPVTPGPAAPPVDHSGEWGVSAIAQPAAPAPIAAEPTEEPAWMAAPF